MEALERRRRRFQKILRGISFLPILANFKGNPFSSPLPPISMLGTSFKDFGRAQTYVTTLIWGQRGGGEDWEVSRIFTPDCRSLVTLSLSLSAIPTSEFTLFGHHTLVCLKGKPCVGREKSPAAQHRFD